MAEAERRINHVQVIASGRRLPGKRGAQVGSILTEKGSVRALPCAVSARMDRGNAATDVANPKRRGAGAVSDALR